MKKTIALAFILTCCLSVVFSQSTTTFTRQHISSFSPASPYPYEFKQPDGTSVTLITKGDGLLNRTYTEDGYTVCLTKNGAFYSTKDESDNYISSGILAHNPEYRNNNEKNILASEPVFPNFSDQLRKDKSNRRASLQNPALKSNKVSGTYHTLLILVDFPDKAAIKTREEFQNYCMQPNYNGTGSVKDFYTENSFGQFDLQIDVFGWYQAQHNWSYYGQDDNNGDDMYPQELAREACQAAEAAGVDFSKYDNDGDGDVDGIQIMHAGGGEEAGTGTDAIWSHSWWMSPLNFDGVSISAYTMNPELYGNSSTTTSIGVVCHEFAHNLGLPDLYDTDYSSDGLGSWDLMSGGSWNNGGRTPASNNAWAKNFLGWHTPTEISSAGSDTLHYSYKSNTSYKITTKTSNEYFILENRQKVGFDKFLPGKGLLIFHIDGNYINSTIHQNSVNDTDNHYGVDLEEADGDAGSSYSADPFPGTSGKTSFTDGTTPSAKSWANASTEKPITNIREIASDSSIVFNLMGGTSPLPITDFTASKTTCYPGQTINFTDVTYNNPTSWLWTFEGATPSTSTLRNPTNITYTESGTYNVTLIATNSYGSDTITKTAMITVTTNYIMESSTITVCSGKFYDAGGIASSYPNSTLKIMTFLPGSQDSVLEFDFYSFNIENTTSCDNDYLEVFDGTSTSATKFGRYCGTTGPGLVRATNSSGALTFKFKSNGTVNSNGWIARVKCVSPNAIKDYQTANFEVYPNPASDNIQVSFKSNDKREVSLYSIDNRLILKQTSYDKQISLNVEEITNGIYFLMIVENNKQTIKKIVIEK